MANNNQNYSLKHHLLPSFYIKNLLMYKLNVNIYICYKYIFINSIDILIFYELFLILEL